MLRRTWLRWMTLSEAQRLVLDAEGRPAPAPRASLPQLLAALTEHHRAGGEVFTKAVLQHVVQLDQSNEDTQHIAKARATAAAATAPSAPPPPQASPSSSQGAPPLPHLITELLRAYPHSPHLRERCCRCVANMCQLSADAIGSAVVPAASATEGVADALVAEGAVELVLGTLSMASRLSGKGRCWAALAMLNLTCMSHNGAARATAAGAVDTLAEFILLLLEDAPAAADAATAAPPIRGLAEETTIALDAALGALTGVLAAEAPENARGVSFNYEATSYGAVDAVVRALLFTSALLVRDGRNDGAYAASLPSRRYGGVHFASASATQQTAVVVLLPLLHKAWMALQAVCGCATNLPMLFDVVYEAANANQESMVVASPEEAGGDGSGGSEEVLVMTAQTERRYVAALSSLVDGALFLTTELEGLGAIGAEELVRLQRDLQLYVMDVMQSMTSSRKDIARKEAAAGAEGSEGEPADAEASAVYPTTAAMSVTDVLTCGSVANMALACAVRLHAEHEGSSGGGAVGAGGRRPAMPAPYPAHDFTLLSKSLVVLANVAEVGDEVATSANAVAALQAVLKDAAEAVTALPTAYGKALAELFRPTEANKADAAGSAAEAAAIDSQDRLSFLQQAALVGQVYAVLWSTLRTAQGVTTVSQLSVLQSAKEVQAALRDSYVPALEAAMQQYGAAAGEAATTTSAQSPPPAWVANTAEETVTRLLKLSNELIGNLEKLSSAAAAGRPPIATAA